MLPGLDTLHLTSHKLPMKQDKQTTYDIAYLKMAREWSKLSYCKRKQVGALIVKDKMIISDGYNGTPTGFENVFFLDRHSATGYLNLWCVLY